MHRILVVDDDKEIRVLLSRFFTRKKYEARTAESAEEAIAMLEREQMDAVLLDIVLPGISGLDALAKIQATWPDLPVVMISGQHDEEVAKAALRAGAFDYVMKPFDFDYLERTVYLKLVERLD